MERGVHAMAANPNKTTKHSGHEQVLLFLSELKHPLKQEIEEVRTIILGADDRLTEHIKWNAPSFCMNGEDRITFQLHGKGLFRLVFHCGAQAKKRAENRRLIEDGTGLLDWAANDRAIVKFTGMSDVEANRGKLVEVIAKWLEAAD